ncbi:MAG: membrane protein [Candidatus Kapaibacterium sp.]|nr:MAG: membrane protein [Candidatus Kapabacteria bacterium]
MSSRRWATVAYEMMLLLAGIASATVGLRGFLLPVGFIDGGITGVSLLLATQTSIGLSVWLVVLNAPFIALAYRSISKQFAFRAAAAIVLLAVAVAVTPLDGITGDKFLDAIFGGIFLGLGIGLAIRGGAVLDGTEIFAIAVSRKTILSIGDVILIFNVVLFSIAAFVLSIEVALYAIITYAVASKAVDFVVDGIEEYIAVTIVSDRSDAIRRAIIEQLGSGCTVLEGKRGFSLEHGQLQKTEVLYSVITRLEVSRFLDTVRSIDPGAFIVMTTAKDLRGGWIKKRRPLH